MKHSIHGEPVVNIIGQHIVLAVIGTLIGHLPDYLHTNTFPCPEKIHIPNILKISTGKSFSDSYNITQLDRRFLLHANRKHEIFEDDLWKSNKGVLSFDVAVTCRWNRNWSLGAMQDASPCHKQTTQTRKQTNKQIKNQATKQPNKEPSKQTNKCNLK